MRPHSRFRRFVSFALAVLVLITSVGLTVQRMTCRISGRSRVAVAVARPGEVRGCGAGKATVREGCCNFSKQVHKLSSPARAQAAVVLLSPPVLLKVPATGPAWPVPEASALPATARARWFAADSSPPPLGGRALLRQACTWQV